MASLSSCRTAAFCFPISTKPSTPGTPGWWDRNGVGKSLLARLLAGHLQPSSGGVRRQGRVRYLAQQLEPADYPTVADLAGVRPWLVALARIEAGSLDAADYECLGERWDIRQRLADALAAEGLGHLRADTRANA